MALTLSIDLDSATFEDLATLISAAGAAGADDSSVVEFDEEQRIIKIIIEDPIAPDLLTDGAGKFSLLDSDYDPSFDDFDDRDDLGDLGEDSDFSFGFEDPYFRDRGFNEHGHGFDREPRPEHPLGNITGAINDFIEYVADEFNPGRNHHRGRGRGFGRGFGRGPWGQNIPSVDHLHRLAEQYFRNYGYRGQDFRDGTRGQRPWGDGPRADNFWNHPFADGSGHQPRQQQRPQDRPQDRQPHPDESQDRSREQRERDFRDQDGGEFSPGSNDREPRDEDTRGNGNQHPFGSPFGENGPFGSQGPFGQAGGGEFNELRNAGENILRGLSDFINDRVDRRTDGGQRNQYPGYGTFGNPDETAGHPEGTSYQDQHEDEGLGRFTDFSQFDKIEDIEDLENLGKPHMDDKDADSDKSAEHGTDNDDDDPRDQEDHDGDEDTQGK